MTVLEFLSHLRRSDVELWADGDKLRYSAPSGTITPDLRAELARRKAEILTFLRGPNVNNTPAIVPIRRDQDLPMSFAQQRLWLLDQLETSRAAYNIPLALRLNGRPVVVALEQSLNEILRRHEALRMTFTVVDGQPVQVIAPALVVTLAVVDLLELGEIEREAEARRLAAEEARRPFDLARGPLVRASLLRLGEEQHVLLLTLHHIVSDGWSTGILFREFSVLYEAFSTGKPSPLPDLPIQYADFAVWQRQWLRGEVLEAQLSYWKKQLDGIPTLQLPTDRARPPVQSFRGKQQSLVLPEALSEALKAFSREERVTLFMTLLAAFKTLLHHYTGQEDIVVGSPIAGRNWAQIEGLIGFFVNTLVLRTDLSGNPSFRELLGRVRKVALGAYALQVLPFEKLVEELQPERDLSRTPLFQVFFNMVNSEDHRTLNLSGVRAEPLESHEPTSKFDLTLYIGDRNGALWFSVVYNPDLFEPATISRLLGHYQTLLESVAANPNRRISELPLLTEAEKHQFLVEWNDTKIEYPKDKCIHQLFEEQVEKSPDAVAVVFEDQQLTYQELNQRANQLAHHLRRRGVGPETLVALCVERSIEMVVGLLAVLKAGGTYVPMDPEYPKARLRFMLEDTHAAVLLTRERLSQLLPEYSGQKVCFDQDWEEITRESEANLRNVVAANNLAYVIYTSGSTGKPKGVMIQHGCVVNFLTSMAQEPGMTSRDTLLAVTSLSFDIAGLEIYLPLSVGGRVVMVSREVAADGVRLAKQLSDCGATMMQATPATWRMLLASGWYGSERLKILCGGEALSDDLANKLVNRCASLWNMYGPTETTIWSAVQRVPADFAKISLGRPIANTQIYIFNQQLQLVPIGVPGELYIGGDGLARGYLNRPELTPEKFVQHPFSDKTGARLYRTGDLVRYLPDGNIEYWGRIDNQVKIRGFRIELGEVEAVLSQNPVVQETVVVAREDVHGDKRLLAYVVPRKEQTPTVSNLRSFLKSKLPEYMVPSTFVFLVALPLTPHGKVDHQGLPDPESDATETGREFVEPRDETERVLCRIWAETLKLERVGIDDDFFAIGGHSLLAAKLFWHLDGQFGRSLPLGVLFSAPTVRALAERYRTAPEQRFRALVALRKSGSLTPVFAVPGVYGNVLCFAELSQALGSDQPFYGLQSVGLDGSEAPLTSIEEMAKLNISELLTVQPQGPYVLIGACFGATVAYEMARQLLADSHEVFFLGLLDPSAREGREANENLGASPRIFKRAAALGSLVTNRLLLYLDELNRLNGKDRVGYIARKLSSLSGSLKHVHDFKGVRRELNQIEVLRANLNAFDHYQRKRLIGRLRTMEIFETARRANDSWCDIVDWDNFSENSIHRHTVPGKDSGQMLMGENCRVVALLLAEQLRTAITRD